MKRQLGILPGTRPAEERRQWGDTLHNQRLEQRAWQRQALHETSTAFLEGGPHPQRLSEVLAVRLARLIGGGCIIRRRVEEPGGPPLACAHARASSLDALQRSFDKGPHALAFACSAQAADSRQPIVLPRVSSQAMHLWTQPAGWPYLDAHQVRSVLVAPVGSSDRVCATIVVWREHPCRPLTDAHRGLLDQVALRIVPALMTQ